MIIPVGERWSGDAGGFDDKGGYPTMKVEYIEPFVAAAMNILSSELGIQVERGKLRADGSYFTTKEVSVLIGITGAVEGNVVYGVHRSVAMDIASRMMGEPVKTFDEMAKSAIGELGNIISGHAAALFEKNKIPCAISPPSLIIGKGTRIEVYGIPRLVIPLDIEFGEIEIGVSLREKR